LVQVIIDWTFVGWGIANCLRLRLEKIQIFIIVVCWVEKFPQFAVFFIALGLFFGQSELFCTLSVSLTKIGTVAHAR